MDSKFGPGTLLECVQPREYRGRVETGDYFRDDRIEPPEVVEEILVMRVAGVFERLPQEVSQAVGAGEDKHKGMPVFFVP